jgi:hypothetical protein
MAARSYAERNFNIEIITDQFEKCALRNAVGTGLDGKGSALAALSLK